MFAKNGYGMISVIEPAIESLLQNGFESHLR